MTRRFVTSEVTARTIPCLVTAAAGGWRDVPQPRGPGPMDGRGDEPPSLPSFSRRLPPSMETTSHYVKAHLGKQGGTERWLDLD